MKCKWSGVKFNFSLVILNRLCISHGCNHYFHDGIHKPWIQLKIANEFPKPKSGLVLVLLSLFVVSTRHQANHCIHSAKSNRIPERALIKLNSVNKYHVFDLANIAHISISIHNTHSLYIFWLKTYRLSCLFHDGQSVVSADSLETKYKFSCHIIIWKSHWKTSSILAIEWKQQQKPL